MTAPGLRLFVDDLHDQFGRWPLAAGRWPIGYTSAGGPELAEADPLAASAEALYEQLTCEKTLMRFTAEEAAADHCEMGNRSLLNTRVLDWLDGVFAEPTGR